MTQEIIHISVLVNDYDEAIAFYTQKLNFVLLEDSDLGGGKRWVVVAPGESRGVTILLAKASNGEQVRCVGQQAGGRVMLFLKTDDIQRDYASMCASGVKFIRQPVEQPYGCVAVFEDLYGNQWDLIQMNDKHALYQRFV